jgi:hypothetical protein
MSEARLGTSRALAARPQAHAHITFVTTADPVFTEAATVYYTSKIRRGLKCWQEGQGMCCVENDVHVQRLLGRGVMTRTCKPMGFYPPN